MTANELAIGDWVCYDGDVDYECPLRIDGISENDVSIEGEGFLGGIEDCIVPIPLTEEILKANGFNIRRDAYYRNCGFLGNDWERSGVEVKFYDRAVIDIECNYFKHTNRVHLIADYVHELQHALRLCGLNDLADNFKLN